MSFIVCPACTTVFRVQISNIKLDLRRPDCNIKDCHFRGNFDNYRTIVSPKTPIYSNGEAMFDEYQALFVYETMVQPPELLVTKIFTINVMGNGESEFIGTAAVDLLTLAAGPQKVVLRLVDGDVVVGRFSFEIVMNDQTDTLVWMRELTVESVGQKEVNLNKLCVEWEPNGVPRGSQTTSFELSALDPANRQRCTMFPRHSHSIPLTLNALHAGAGVTFTVKSSSALCFSNDLGSVTLMFVDGIKDVEEENQVQNMDRSVIRSEAAAAAAATGAGGQGNAGVVLPREDGGGDGTAAGGNAAPTRAAASPSRSTNAKGIGSAAAAVAADVVPLSSLLSVAPSERRFERVVEFRVETSGGQDNQGEAFVLSGRIWLSKIPIFAQMIGGITVEGVVCGGSHVPGVHPRPPFTEHEDSGI